MGQVSIVRVKENIKESLYHSIQLIGGISKFIQHGDRILLKPNLNGWEGTTNRIMVEALIQLLLDYQVRSIAIGESTFGDAQTTKVCFQKTGFQDLVKKYHLPLINFNQSETVSVPVPHPLILKNIPIAKEYFEADVIINLPVMKVHYATGITLGLKNLKGFLPPEEKKHFHEIGLDQAIVDLNKAITTQLTIVDAIQAMERMGPRGGDMVPLNLIMVGENNWEVDWVGMNIMGYQLSEVKHLRYYLEDKNIDEQRIQEVKVVGESIENARHPFKKVAMEAIIPPSFNLYQTNACSACMNALLLSCSFLEGIPTVPIDVFLGSNIVEFPSNHHLRLSFGNCCTKKTDNPLSIPGCPPYPFNLNLLLKQRGLIKKEES